MAPFSFVLYDYSVFAVYVIIFRFGSLEKKLSNMMLLKNVSYASLITMLVLCINFINSQFLSFLAKAVLYFGMFLKLRYYAFVWTSYIL